MTRLEFVPYLSLENTALAIMLMFSLVSSLWFSFLWTVAASLLFSYENLIHTISFTHRAMIMEAFVLDSVSEPWNEAFVLDRVGPHQYKDCGISFPSPWSYIWSQEGLFLESAGLPVPIAVWLVSWSGEAEGAEVRNGSGGEAGWERPAIIVVSSLRDPNHSDIK